MNYTNQYTINDDKTLLSFEKVCYLLSKSYWASNRDKEKIRKSIENSICYGVYLNQEQVGFARVVTDYSTVYWLCDLIIDEEHRGKGLGKKLIEYITNTEILKDITGILATRDAHGLYESYGFKNTRNFMRKKPSD